MSESVEDFLAEQWRKKVEAAKKGDSVALVAMLERLVHQGHPDIPEKVQRRLTAALMNWQLGKSASLDQALGIDTSPSSRAQRKLDMHAGGIYSAINEMRKQLEQDNSQRKDVFAEVGKRWGLSSGQAKAYYYAFRDYLKTR